MKTLEEWSGNLYDYLAIGDEVDEEMVEYFRDILPPTTYRSNLIQCGEPYSHVRGRATYTTFINDDGKWYYTGHCHAGETQEPAE